VSVGREEVEEVSARWWRSLMLATASLKLGICLKDLLKHVHSECYLDLAEFPTDRARCAGNLIRLLGGKQFRAFAPYGVCVSR
jgi:hypothetical protein